MKMLKQEKGFALVLAVMVLMIFAILGLSLMTLTANGAKKNKTRQDFVQATDLADKGIEYMTNDIQKYLAERVKNGVGKQDFIKLLDDTLKDGKFACSNNNGGYTIPGENGSQTKVCIEKIETITGDENALKRLVTFKSTGLVDGKEKTVRSKVLFGTDSIPDQLRYSISTNDNGNLFLHGGVEIQGDVKVDGNLILSEQATWEVSSNYKWENSVPAKIINATNSITPKLIMNPSKNFYVLNIKNKPTYSNHISGSYLNYTNYYYKYSPTMSNASSVFASKFFNTPNLQVVTKELPDDNLDVQKIINNKKKKNPDYKNITVTNNNNPFKNLNKSSEKYIEGEKICVEKGIFSGCTKYETRALTISGDNKNAIELKGQLYLNGNLKIENTNLKSDALIYVNGDVDIRESTLNGINENSTLIIFATGNINIVNISKYSDTPSKIKGFFYTKSNMLMYGVISNIQLQGGISANRLILSAVRGSSDSNGPKHSSQEQATKNSRLQIIYDHNLISQYTQFKRDEESEVITEVIDPEIIEKRF